MKKLLLFSLLFSFTICNAQFWSENFTVAGCNSGNPANGYVSPSGTWTVSNTGANDASADIWFVSAKGNNTGVGNCATGCGTTNNSSLHVGNAAIPLASVPQDSAVTYLTGVFCPSLSICSTTHKRAESPVINCAGQSGISVSFIYLEGGEAADDDARFWYSADGGTTWSQIDALAKTTVCGGSSGFWTAFTGSLPASADNNPNVKIGFNWTNDNDATGTDPSFAVDDISLTSTVGIDVNTKEDENAYFDGNNIVIRSTTAFKVLSVMNVLGESIPFTSNGNVIQLKKNTEGIYFLRIETGKQVVTRKVQMLR